MYSFARLGLVLLGLHGVLAAFQEVSELVVQIRTSDGALANGELFLFGLLWLGFSLTPPLVVLVFSRRLAGLVFPGASSTSESPDADSFLAAGLSVLGAFLVLTGVSLLIGAATTAYALLGFLEADVVASRTLPSALSGVWRVLVGVAAFFLAPRAVSFLAQRRRAA